MRATKQPRTTSAWRLIAQAEKALQEAVAEVVEAHRRSGDPLVVWQDGRVRQVYPQAALLREKPPRYGR